MEKSGWWGVKTCLVQVIVFLLSFLTALTSVVTVGLSLGQHLKRCDDEEGKTFALSSGLSKKKKKSLGEIYPKTY